MTIALALMAAPASAQFIGGWGFPLGASSFTSSVAYQQTNTFVGGAGFGLGCAVPFGYGIGCGMPFGYGGYGMGYPAAVGCGVDGVLATPIAAGVGGCGTGGLWGGGFGGGFPAAWGGFDGMGAGFGLGGAGINSLGWGGWC